MDRARSWRASYRSIFSLGAIALAHAAVFGWAAEQASQDQSLPNPTWRSEVAKPRTTLVLMTLAAQPRQSPHEPQPFSLALKSPPPLPPPAPSFLADSSLAGEPAFLDRIQWPDFSVLGPGSFAIQAEFGDDGRPSEIIVLSESWNSPQAAAEIRQLAMLARAPKAGSARLSFIIDPAQASE